MNRPGRLLVAAVVAATALGCSVAASVPPTIPTPSESDAGPSPSPSAPLGTPSASATALAGPEAPIAAASWLLEQSPQGTIEEVGS